MTMLSVGVFGFLILLLGTYITPFKNWIGALRYHGYPKISYFNRPENVPLVSISSKNEGCRPGDKNCFQTKFYANPGDTITVQVDFKNTSDLEATGSNLSIIPRRVSANSLVFKGGIAATNGPRSMDSAI